MNLYLLQQDDNFGYDTYDSCVVVANSPEEAKLITPDGNGFDSMFRVWANNPSGVAITYLGTADDSLKLGEVICASFNAG